MKLERLLRELAGGRRAPRGGYGGHGYRSAGHHGTGAPHSGGGIGETIGRMVDRELARRRGRGHAPRGGGDLASQLLRRFGGRRY
ncbi:MAG: hypothetical protein M3P95_09265 [Actinomycetota bacterium]|jgi:hypothetical protein|nr:hypothetical protein [Actinomycetota bacterium]